MSFILPRISTHITEALTPLKYLREYIKEREISQGNVLAEPERVQEIILRLRQANARQRHFR